MEERPVQDTLHSYNQLQETEPWFWHRFAGSHRTHSRQGRLIVQLFAAVLATAALVIVALGMLR